MTTLQRQIELVMDQYRSMRIQLDKEEKKAIDKLWEIAITTGQLKNELQ